MFGGAYVADTEMVRYGHVDWSRRANCRRPGLSRIEFAWRLRARLRADLLARPLRPVRERSYDRCGVIHEGVATNCDTKVSECPSSFVRDADWVEPRSLGAFHLDR